MVKRNTAKNGSYFFSVIAAICLTLFLFALAVVLVLNAGWLYELDVRFLHLEEATGLSKETILANYKALIAYNRVWNRAALVFPTLPMSKTGAIHFQEVKRIFDVLQVLGMAGGIFSVVLFVRMRTRQRKAALRITAVLALAIPVVLGILAALDWDRFFVTFHHIFFNNDYWLFDPATDPVILILPDTYFLHCAVGILAIIALGSLVCFLLSRGGEKRRRR